MFLALAVLSEKQTFSLRVSSIHIFSARGRYVFLLPRRRSYLPAGAVTLGRSLTCGGACIWAWTSRWGITSLQRCHLK